MDYDDLMDFEEEDIGPLSCYVCGTAVDVIVQDVVKNTEPLECVELPVCPGCRSAVGLVIQLEDDFEKVSEANNVLSVRASVLAALLEEGRRIVKNLLSEKEEMGEIVAGLLEYTDDLEKRIEAGAGLNDVEFDVIPSAAYED